MYSREDKKYFYYFLRRTLSRRGMERMEYDNYDIYKIRQPLKPGSLLTGS